MARILLADDDSVVRELARRTLAGEGHDVVAVADGLEALAQFDRGTFDLIVSDLYMPGLDGLGLISNVLPRSPGVKALLMSGLADELKRAEGFPRDRVATLQKPFSLDQLREGARKLLAG